VLEPCNISTLQFSHMVSLVVVGCSHFHCRLYLDDTELQEKSKTVSVGQMVDIQMGGTHLS